MESEKLFVAKQAKASRVLAKIFQRSFHNSTNLRLDLIDCFLFGRQSHPTELNGLSNLIINLLRAKKCSHPLVSVGIIW